jgi:hypothetical protein
LQKKKKKKKKKKNTDSHRLIGTAMTAAVANIFELFDESIHQMISPSDDSFESLLYTASPPPSSTSASEHEPIVSAQPDAPTDQLNREITTAFAALNHQTAATNTSTTDNVANDDDDQTPAAAVLLPTSVPIVSLAAEMEKFRQLTALHNAFGGHAQPATMDADDEDEDDDDEFSPSSEMSTPGGAGGGTNEDSDSSSTVHTGKRRAVAHSKRNSSDGGASSGDDGNTPVKRKGRRAAAEIIIARVGDPTKLNAPPADCDPSIRRVALTRERLLTISGDEMEQRFDELNSMFSLTSAEQKEMRRQRRLVKNREYAQQSRNKKKVAATSVDSKLDGLKRSNDELRERVRAAEHEAASMRARIDAALNIASNAGAAGAALIAALVGSAQAAAEPIATAKRRRRGDATDDEDALPQAGHNGAAAAGGAVLMVMLLSFGVFLNAGFLSKSTSVESITTPQSASQTMMRTAAPSSNGAAAVRGQQFTGRALLGTCDDELFGAAPLNDAELADKRQLLNDIDSGATESDDESMPELIV